MNQAIIGEARYSANIGMIRHSPPCKTTGCTSAMGKGLGLKDVIYSTQRGRGTIFSQLQKPRDCPQNVGQISAHNFLESFRKIPSSVFSASNQLSDIDESNPICSICLEKYVNGDEILTLACDHCFHSDCIGKWFCRDFFRTVDPAASFRCPQCRQDHVSLSEKNSSSCSDLCDVQNHITKSSFVRVGQNIANEVDYDILCDWTSCASSMIKENKSSCGSYSDCGIPTKT